MKFYLLYKNNGLYDPVLDDQEPLYDTYEPLDFDQQSQPTEVQFQIKQFTNTPSLDDNLVESLNLTDYTDILNVPNGLPESRSLTASPFVLPVKPYRPFSTEPLPDVPPLEDPIILNPNYKDEWGKHQMETQEKYPETKFKLPISEQYDPDGKKKYAKQVNERSEYTKEEKLEEKITKEEYQFLEKMNQEIDISKIEKTASEIVNESIERAVSVAEVIKNEIDVELQEYSSSSLQNEVSIKENNLLEDLKTNSEVAVVQDLESMESMKTEMKIEEKTAAKEVKQLVEIIDRTTEEIVKKSGSQEDFVKSKENFETDHTFEKSSIKKSMAFEKEHSQNLEEVKASQEKVANMIQHREYKDNKTEKFTKSADNTKVTNNMAGSKFQSRTTAQERVYAIGLETIPNIRGVITSSYHYDLLLKTFFIHLTDVMVALSRFILTQPVLSTDTIRESAQESLRKTVDVENEKRTFNSTQERVDIAEHKKENTVEVKKIIEPTIVKETQYEATENKEKDYESLEVEEIFQKRKISGAKMAQMTERKSAELTQKMDAVISEFQTKSGIEENETRVLSVQRDRRSRSRSKIEEEVMQESDPLEWLSKVDSVRKSEEITELKSSTKEFSSNVSETRKELSIHESKETKTSKTKPGKQTYVAIVEAHVYTNKDAILEEQITDISETASIVSADEINTAIVVNKAVSTQKVGLESTLKQEIAKTITEDHSLSLAKNEIVEEKLQESIVEEVNTVNVKQSAEFEKTIEIEASKIQEVAIQEIIQPVKEIQEISTKIEETEMVAIKEEQSQYTVEESTELFIEENKKETEIQEVAQEQKLEVQEEATAVAVEVTEVIETSHKSDENVDVSAEQTVVIHTDPKPPTVVDEYAELKIKKEQVTEIQESIEMTEEEYNLTKRSIERDVKVHQSVYESEQIQESSFMAKSVEKNLHVQTDLTLERQSSQGSVHSDENNNIDTPTPSTVPPTPVVDEYLFRLEIPLPKIRGTTPIPQDPSPERDEDPHIVKKKLIPHIDTTIESVIYDPPLPTPPEDKVESPVYTKPGLKGGADQQDIMQKEEIREIERKSSLLASAIDETIKSIEEYKEQVGIETKHEVKKEKVVEMEISESKKIEEKIISKKEVKVETQPVMYNGYSKLVESKIVLPKEEISEQKIQEEFSKVEEQVKHNNKEIIELSRNSFQSEGALTKLETNQKDSTEILSNVESLASEVKVESSDNVTKIEKSKIINKSETSSVNVELNKSKSLEKESSKLTSNQVKVERNESINNSDVKQEKLSSIETQHARETCLNEIAEKQSKIIEETSKILENKSNVADIKTDVTFENNHFKTEVTEGSEVKFDPLLVVKPVKFDPQAIRLNKEDNQYSVQDSVDRREMGTPVYVTENGDPLGTVQGIVDGLEDAVVDEEVARELGKPGMSEEKIAELISGESEMLREAHVMGLQRVLSSHMHRANDDSSVDFERIKPVIQSLKDSEVLKALNEEIMKAKEEKKREERKWTTFLQKPKRAVPRVKYGYHGWVQTDEEVEEPYKVKIVKQPKPKVAPDFKPEDFDTGPLPWEERALNTSPPVPIEAEEPILVPEEVPEFLEAVDPLPESEVPDLEDTGIALPPEPVEEVVIKEPTPPPQEPEVPEELDLEAVVEETQQIVVEMEENRLAEQLLMNVQSMVDPNAPLEQQLSQMRAQLAALAQLPGVIQQTLENVTKQLSHITHQETHIKMEAKHAEQLFEQVTEKAEENHMGPIQEDQTESLPPNPELQVVIEEVDVNENRKQISAEEYEIMRREEEQMIEEQKKIEKQKKEQMEKARLESESRQVKQCPTPRVGKPKPVFGPAVPVDRPLVLPGGRRWRNPKDVYNDQFIAETLQAQAEIIQGKALGINFMKYEKPPVSLDHLKHSEVYKAVHNMDDAPLKRVELRTPVIAEADYRERCRSLTPNRGRVEEHLDIPQQLQP